MMVFSFLITIQEAKSLIDSYYEEKGKYKFKKVI